MEEWKKYKLHEIGRIVGGATPPTKDSANYDGEISWITPKDLSNFTGRYIQKGERSITQKGFESSSCQILPKGSILFSSRAPIGYIAIAANELCTNQGFKSIIPDNNLVNNLFLYYLLKYNKEEIEGLGSGTTFKEVSAKVMQNFDIKIPSIQTQKKIADILSSLDDKIELNRRINDNLKTSN
ncbi:Type I restriction modification DNA specificity domain protein [uncultured Prevotella sp.]|uniref:restriction endonuclease subunit S n=1 Tax=uncultured Prevotella sp. TaxID=159272 RepID=UPI001A4A7CC5|nr:restriction endonuclease subunit S [uncultured Prevotella sp.]VTY06672.1 Type I restriction modification DNA specificity domain protein [uncultured Prevotella sp.]